MLLPKLAALGAHWRPPELVQVPWACFFFCVCVWYFDYPGLSNFCLFSYRSRALRAPQSANLHIRSDFLLSSHPSCPQEGPSSPEHTILSPTYSFCTCHSFLPAREARLSELHKEKRFCAFRVSGLVCLLMPLVPVPGPLALCTTSMYVFTCFWSSSPEEEPKLCVRYPMISYLLLAPVPRQSGT